MKTKNVLTWRVVLSVVVSSCPYVSGATWTKILTKYFIKIGGKNFRCYCNRKYRKRISFVQQFPKTPRTVVPRREFLRNSYS